MSRQRASQSLRSPERPDLPYFAYGLFKPGELAYGQLESLIEGVPAEAHVYGSLYVMDGLPLLKPGGLNLVRGYLLRFRKGETEDAYDTICAFEPPRHYCWHTIVLSGTGERANVLIGIDPDKASVVYEGTEWSGRQDPVFTTGLSVVRQVVDQHAGEEFPSTPGRAVDWPRLFRLQMAYLFLWSIIERYAGLAYGPKLRPEKKVEKFGLDPAFARALRVVKIRAIEEVCDARNPENCALLDVDDPASSLDYYRYVRHNVTHRGKGAWNDGERVRHSLCELHQIVGLVLEERMGLEIERPDSRASSTEWSTKP